MKQRYLGYYERYCRRAPLAFLVDALVAKPRTRKLSLINRQRDYLRLDSEPQHLVLHRELNRRLWQASRSWSDHDYGEGYFYQSFPRIGITGLRDTEARVEAMGLRRLLAGKRVLEIGCNTGFLALSIADVAESVVGFDINPHLIGIAEVVADHLGITNTEFQVSSFEELSSGTPFDVVLSFANHATYDGNTRQSIEAYFDRCRDLINSGGLLLFESHPAAYEGDGLVHVCQVLDTTFSVQDQRILDYGTFFDRGRTFVVAERPPVEADACRRTARARATATAPAS